MLEVTGMTFGTWIALSDPLPAFLDRLGTTWLRRTSAQYWRSCGNVSDSGSTISRAPEPSRREWTASIPREDCSWKPRFRATNGSTSSTEDSCSASQEYERFAWSIALGGEPNGATGSPVGTRISDIPLNISRPHGGYSDGRFEDRCTTRKCNKTCPECTSYREVWCIPWESHHRREPLQHHHGQS